jgi:AbrB family looped-hinge helix DNA binding protein
MRLNSKGQVTIPAALRERHGLHEGDEVDVIEDGSTPHLLPVDRANRSLTRVTHRTRKATLCRRGLTP